MNCQICEVRKHCEGYKLAYANKKGCCFGKPADWCSEVCKVAELCILKNEAPGLLAIEVETPGYRCFAMSHSGWDAATDSPCSICDLYEQCKETHIDKPGVIAVLEEA